MSAWFRRVILRQKLGEATSIGAMQPVSTPVTRAVEKLKKFFERQYVGKQLYIALEDLDPQLQAAISTAAMIIERCMKGFTLEVGTSVSEDEAKVIEELKKLDKILRPYIYDIARKIIRDGDAVYLVEVKKGEGITRLTWLPIDQLTILESKDQWTRFNQTIQEPNWYVLNETGRYGKTQWFKRDQVVHFNWGKQEKIRDMYNRLTLGIYNDPPLEALSSYIIWKFSLVINDMLWREVNVPREHHMLPSAPFDPSLFSGDTYEERLKNAQKAAENYLKAYVDKLKERRVDRGYVTLDNVKIDVIEPKLQYTEPNELIEQINQAIYSSVGAPESAVSGRAKGTYASEIAVESYLLLKSEFLAERIAEKFIQLAKRHLTVKYGNKYEHLYDKISYDVQLIFFPREMARTVAILRETGLFTATELRRMFGLPPLTEEQMKELVGPTSHRHTETSKEIAATEKRRVRPDVPETPHSEGQRQVT